MQLNVHFTAGDGKGWAIDEDLRQIRLSVAKLVRDSSPSAADIIHAAYWGNLFRLPEFLLREKYVIVHADNPPFYSLKQVEFAKAQQWVNLWVARSTEAESQFRRLGLPVVHIPYTIDPSLFFPITDRLGLRRKYGIPENAYVIANFHRDSEGVDLSTPKFQKAPELMIAILQRLHAKGLPIHALVAGPRRHWIRQQLVHEGIPFTFVGRDTGSEDDFGVNILSRNILNELYNCADLYLIPSRWEGGPQSAMEAVACRIATLSTPVGVARDILAPTSIFHSVNEAVARIQEDIGDGSLQANIEAQYERWEKSHTTETLTTQLAALYGDLSKRSFQKQTWSGRLLATVRSMRIGLLNRWAPPQPASSVAILHDDGHHPIIDQTIANLRRFMEWGNVALVSSGAQASFCGYLHQKPQPSKGVYFQIYSPDLEIEQITPEAIVICSSVADALHFRSRNHAAAFVVLPFLEDSMRVESSSDGAGSPMIVGDVTPDTSWQVWNSLIHGQPVVYPEDSAFYEQVFHGGLSYKKNERVESLSASIENDHASFQRMIRVPNREETLAMFERLLKLPFLR
jgi:glycosyltransferase involved in cell wall biosynthesis